MYENETIIPGLPTVATLTVVWCIQSCHQIIDPLTTTIAIGNATENEPHAESEPEIGTTKQSQDLLRTRRGIQIVPVPCAET